MRATTILISFFIAQVLCRNVPNSEVELQKSEKDSGDFDMLAPNIDLLEEAVHHLPWEKPVKDIRHGDILWRPEYNQYFDDHSIQYDAIKNKQEYWPNPQGVPYTTSGINGAHLTALNDAIDEFKAKTCIRFKRRTNERNYIRIFKDDGCYSYVGMIGGGQELSLGEGCQYKSTAVHELMHALGFFHEQERPDRDKYVIVRYNNMQQGAASQFEKQKVSDVQYFGQKYDYVSVMHYERKAFSKNGRNTIEARGDPTKYLGQPLNGGLSEIDVIQLNAMYCGGKVTATTTPKPGGVTTTRQPGGGVDLTKIKNQLANLQKFMNRKIDNIEKLVAAASRKGDEPLLLENNDVDLIEEIKNDEMELKEDLEELKTETM